MTPTHGGPRALACRRSDSMNAAALQRRRELLSHRHSGWCRDSVLLVNRETAGHVVPLVPIGELRQAEYYRALLDQQRGRLEEKIADHVIALQTCQDNGEVREIRRLRQRVAEKRREQFEVDCLRQALQRRFFPSQATRVGPARWFDIDIARDGSWWRIWIPEIEAVTKVRRREDVELMAREHIAVIINAPIAEVAVRVVRES
jgi:hypothetical protein